MNKLNVFLGLKTDDFSNSATSSTGKEIPITGGSLSAMPTIPSKTKSKMSV